MPVGKDGMEARMPFDPLDLRLVIPDPVTADPVLAFVIGMVCGGLYVWGCNCLLRRML